ncbi:MAG TPA: ATP-binding protein, partial [Chroococcidiopsis sp.]
KLHHLIQNFLFYTNLECAIADPSQLFALQQQRVVYPSNVIGDAALQAAHRAERQADLRLDLKDVILPMAELHLQKLVAELVDNAFQYSEPGTPVSVSSQIETLAEGLLYTLTISDRGRGMTSEQITNLTADLLHPPSPLEVKGYASTKPGLGWAIAQRLTTLHHGKLAIHSVPKQYTTVQIRFPILAIVLPAPSESPSDALSAAL